MAAHRSTRARVDALHSSLGPGPWSRDELLATGWSPGRIARAVEHGLLVRERRGVYAAAPDSGRQLVLGDDLHAARLRATARRLAPSAAFSHTSAARLLGLWTPDVHDDRIHVTIPGQAEREDAGLRVHASALPASSVVVVDGVRVTDVARTAVDLARPGDLPHALVAVDGALRELLRPAYPDLDRELRGRRVPSAAIEQARARLAAVVEPMVGWPGVRTARAAVEAADPASASPFESWSRGWILAVRMPVPELNLPIVGASGAPYVGDFVWEERRVVGEADGVAKYGSTSAQIRAAMRAERARQADLEAAGWRVVRWVAGETGATIIARLGRALYLQPAVAARRLRRPA
ncbi:MAG: hypothetical protein GC157_15545 [Frankiales bacterium]|nr:hypothetical protein [Frankiales bacterium]